jgi:hypothetical protein
MAIEKLERLDCTQDFNGFELGRAYMNLCADGDYVSYEASRAREDVLLEALKKLESYLDFSTPVKRNEPITFEVVDGINAAFENARDVIREIKATQ